MYAYVEEPTRAHCDSTIQSLSWMGKAPDGQPESGTAWRLSETSYYEDGWLASGNTRGVVGVTMTACSSRSGGAGSGNTNSGTADLPVRTNFNLRGHRSEVSTLRTSFLPMKTDKAFFPGSLDLAHRLRFRL